MAEQRQKPAEAAPAAAAPPKKGLPIKTIVILVGVLVLEAATVMVVFMIAGKPPDVTAAAPEEDPALKLEEPVEELVVEDRFPNLTTGVSYIYDTQVYVVVKAKHQERVKEDLEKMRARIATDISQIISRAQPAHFAEPTRATLSRQIKAALDERLGKDADGELIAQQVLINKMLRYKVDN